MIDDVYHRPMGAVKMLSERESAASGAALSAEMLQFVDHLAELLAEEYAAALKEERDASGGLCEVLEREPTGAEHRRSDPGVPRLRAP